METAVRLIKLSITATLALTACGSGQRESRTVVIEGRQIRIMPQDQATYVQDGVKILRVQLNSDVDLILDERFHWNVSPDFMSVLPVDYGLGRRKRIGQHEVACGLGDQLKYMCGLRHTVDKITCLVVFRDEPMQEAVINDAIAASRNFLMRSTIRA